MPRVGCAEVQLQVKLIWGEASREIVEPVVVGIFALLNRVVWRRSALRGQRSSMCVGLLFPSSFRSLMMAGY